MAEPTFRYHPDPVATGSAVSTDTACSLCGIQRGIRYAGPVYGKQPDTLCLHCIASGEAAERLGHTGIGPAMFSDAINVPDDVPADVVDEVTMRTPGFFGWQQEGWLYHCADAAAFLGRAGYAELVPYPGWHAIGLEIWTSHEVVPVLVDLAEGRDPGVFVDPLDETPLQATFICWNRKLRVDTFIDLDAGRRAHWDGLYLREQNVADVSLTCLYVLLIPEGVPVEVLQPRPVYASCRFLPPLLLLA